MPPRGHSSSSHSSRSSSSRSSSSRSFSHSSSSRSSSRSYSSRSSSDRYRSDRYRSDRYQSDSSNDDWNDGDSPSYNNDDYYDTPGSIGLYKMLIIVGIILLSFAGLAWFFGSQDSRSTSIIAEEQVGNTEEATVDEGSADKNPAVSNTDIFGEDIYLKKIDNNTYKMVSGSEFYDLKLSWNSEYESYYSIPDDCYLWYNTEVIPNLWQYWYEGISSDYGDYGWMEYEEPDGWFIETDDSTWVELPSKYDSSKLWHIVDDEPESNSDDTEEAGLNVDVERPAPDVQK